MRLDLNLEKGRIREESVSQELKIKETETKIEQEVGALRPAAGAGQVPDAAMADGRVYRLRGLCCSVRGGYSCRESKEVIGPSYDRTLTIPSD